MDKEFAVVPVEIEGSWSEARLGRIEDLPPDPTMFDEAMYERAAIELADAFREDNSAIYQEELNGLRRLARDLGMDPGFSDDPGDVAAAESMAWSQAARVGIHALLGRGV